MLPRGRLMDQQALDVQFEIMEQNDMSEIIGTPLASGKLTGEYAVLESGMHSTSRYKSSGGRKLRNI